MEDESLPRTSRSWWQRGVLALGITAVLACLAAVGAVGYSWWRLDQIERVGLNLRAATEGVENYLVVGSDSRANVAGDDPNKEVLQGSDQDGRRSDTIMIVRVDAKQELIEALSVPRDLYVKLPNGRSDRINVAYSLGRQQLIDTLHSSLDIDINHYVEVDFNAFKKIVEAVGGVPLWFDVPMRDYNSGIEILTPGCHVLNGDQALAFARSRHAEFLEGRTWKADPTADLGRITRQQLFIRRIGDRASSKGLTDPLRAKKLLDSTTQYVSVDKGLSNDALLRLVSRFRNWSGDDLATYTLPTYSFTTQGGASVVGLRAIEAQPTLNHFRGLPEGHLANALVKVDVVNRSGKAALTNQVADAFKTVGFTTTSSRADNQRLTRTEIDYGPGARPAAELLERHLSAGAKLVANDKLARDTVQLIVGTDFTTVTQTPREQVTPAPTTAAPATSRAPAPTTVPTTAAPATPSTTAPGRAIGIPPPGVDC